MGSEVNTSPPHISLERPPRRLTTTAIAFVHAAASIGSRFPLPNHMKSPAPRPLPFCRKPRIPAAFHRRPFYRLASNRNTIAGHTRLHARFPCLEFNVKRYLRCALWGAVLLACAEHGHAQLSLPATPEGNPGRPTFSTPATLTPVGYLQFETGGLYAASSAEFSTRFGVNQVTKLTVAPRLQVFALSEPFIHAADATGDALSGNRPGEVFAGLQGVIVPGAGRRPTISLSYIRRLYESPAPEIDIGTFRQSALFLLSEDLGKFHFDVNGIFSEQVAGTLRRGQFGQTLSISHPVGPFTLAGELWHFSQPLTTGNAVGNLWALSYPIRKNLIVDAGFDHGLTSSSTKWEGFAGFTYVLPRRLWKSPKGEGVSLIH